MRTEGEGGFKRANVGIAFILDTEINVVPYICTTINFMSSIHEYHLDTADIRIVDEVIIS